jgi:hypothetical protein
MCSSRDVLRGIMPAVPYDPEESDPDDRSLPDIGDLVDDILRGGDDPGPTPTGA